MAEKAKKTQKKSQPFGWVSMLLFVTLFQIVSAMPVLFNADEPDPEVLMTFGGFVALEWGYFICARWLANQRATELEIIAFMLSGIGLVTVASVYPEYAFKQFIAIVIGLAAFVILLAIMRNVEVISALRPLVAVAAVGLLALNLVLARTINGALNWINIGSFSIQPSEIVKIAFIFVGAATLEKLQSSTSQIKYLVFSLGCVGALFLMRDFGTALIFFATFMVIAFMRSGDVKTIGLLCVGAILGAGLIIYFKPYVASRFESYRHVWEYINEGGFQQTRVLIYSSSGGLFGLGIGEGRLRNVYASTTDLIFGVICEEWGMLVAFCVVLCFAFVGVYALRLARHARSTVYSIAAVAAAAMLLVQLSLNVFGITDLLPLTGVTLPFISRGGTSMICSWALFAFIKSADIKTYPKLEKQMEDK
ncbi:MAG: FtsW/RodA/SpoVE family cell cycle protein [Clostridia bacterium]|nr:FtsW/RodA/SpoVE family cell cycle protein [Clostridia bacterium]